MWCRNPSKSAIFLAFNLNRLIISVCSGSTVSFTVSLLATSWTFGIWCPNIGPYGKKPIWPVQKSDPFWMGCGWSNSNFIHICPTTIDIPTIQTAKYTLHSMNFLHCKNINPLYAERWDHIEHIFLIFFPNSFSKKKILRTSAIDCWTQFSAQNFHDSMDNQNSALQSSLSYILLQTLHMNHMIWLKPVYTSQSKCIFLKYKKDCKSDKDFMRRSLDVNVRSS